MRDQFGETSLYVDRRTQIPFGMQVRLDIRDTPMDIIYSDWINRDGARLFTRFVLTDGDDLYTYQFSHIGFDKIGADAMSPDAIGREFAPAG